jgi:hypothetical protein
MPLAPLHVHLIARDNGAGLSRDIQVVRQALLAEPGFQVTVSAIGRRSGLRKRCDKLRLQLRTLLRHQPRYDINVMFEHVRSEYFHLARHNVLIPNPEWFHARWERHLPRIDAVLAKTRHAERLFGGLGVRTIFTGFTSPDHWRPDLPRQPHFLHLPGRSANKGTLALLQLWREHPEWPLLTIVWRRKRIDPGPLPANVVLRRDRMDDEQFAALQNRVRFHLCPSRTEGYGHSLGEALGTGAVVLTLDAEPMNELVDRDRGVLVPARAVGRQALATLYDFAPGDMAAAVERCRRMDEDEVRARSERAPAWFVDNAAAFRQRLRGALQAVVHTGPDA